VSIHRVDVVKVPRRIVLMCSVGLGGTMLAIPRNRILLGGTERDIQADMIRLMALSRDCSGWGDVNGWDASRQSIRYY